mmetsp:Transcript_38689/g.97249  ORF Transcript_38689/g.97249 Transcript_38689/m.97249 type:complete len:810 (-) Transcript_38689:212-2641(-)
MSSCRLKSLLAAGFLLPSVIAVSANDSFDGRPALDIDLYRAMQSEGINQWPLQNVNLASVDGVTKYLHTEVIAEHVVGDSERNQRKYGIDAFAKIRFKVKNPSSVVTNRSIVTQVNFGPFVTFDSGKATNPLTQTLIKAHGGFVGVQKQQDPRWPYRTPYYWFSVTGWCPNVPYFKVPMTRHRAEQIISNRSSFCPQLEGKLACERSSGDCVYEEGACIAKDPAPECLNYTSASGHPSHVLGGLCPEGDKNLVTPSGRRGCTYSYSEANQVSIDKVAGILDEDCSGRRCTSWIDFRHHCSNSDYRRKFNPATGRLEPFKYCIEYDISPVCQADCSNLACQALPESEREIGLPFWQGRCNEQANSARTRHVAASFGLAHAEAGHDLTKSRLKQQNASAGCIHETSGMCAPSAGQGGNYCTRQWGGVCTTCFVPGTYVTWPATTMPYCPYSILSSPDYKDGFPPPKCASPHPRDLCCLYTGGCSLSGSDPAQAPLDEDGFALVASWDNSSLLVAFFMRLAESHDWSIDQGRLASFASMHLGPSPSKGATLQKTIERMTSLLILVVPSTTTTSSTAFGFNVISSVEHETQGLSMVPVSIAIFVIGAGFCVVVVAGAILHFLRHLGSRPSEPWARTDGKLPVRVAFGHRATAEPDIEVPSPAVVLSPVAAQVVIMDQPRLGLSGRSVAGRHQSQDLGWELDKNEPLSQVHSIQRLPNQELLRPLSSAALAAALPRAKAPDRRSNGSGSERRWVCLDGPGEEVAVTGTAACGSIVASQVDVAVADDGAEAEEQIEDGSYDQFNEGDLHVSRVDV